jgi:hypothetical protein
MSRPRRREIVVPFIFSLWIVFNLPTHAYSDTWQRILAVILLAVFVVIAFRWMRANRRYHAHVAAGGREDPGHLPEAPPRV